MSELKKNNLSSSQVPSTDDKNALIAYRWIIALAELQFSYNITLGNYQLRWYHATNLLEGRRPAKEIFDELELMQNDREAYGQFVSHEIKSPIPDSNQNQDAVELLNLPSMTGDAGITDFLKADISQITHKAMNDAFREYHAYEDGAKINYTDEEIALHEAASRLVWIDEARRLYNNGELYIKTEYGTLLPAIEKYTVKMDGEVIQDRVIDNKPLSTDNIFYAANGRNIYTEDKYFEKDFGYGRYKTKKFCSGTPDFDDISDASLIMATNEYLHQMALKSAFLATGLAADVSPLFNGIQSPVADMNAEEILIRHHADIIHWISGDAEGQAVIKDILDQKMQRYGETITGFLQATQDKIQSQEPPQSLSSDQQHTVRPLKPD